MGISGVEFDFAWKTRKLLNSIIFELILYYWDRWAYKVKSEDKENSGYFRFEKSKICI